MSKPIRILIKKSQVSSIEILDYDNICQAILNIKHDHPDSIVTYASNKGNDLTERFIQLLNKFTNNIEMK